MGLAVQSAEDARQAVRDQATAGYDFVKVYTNLSGEAYEAIIETAADNRLPVAGHVPRGLTIEDMLVSGGLFSIAAYLHGWNRHVKLCTRVIPTHRRLILRTHELALSRQRLAAFLQIPEDSIDISNAHLNRAGGSGPMEPQIDRTYLNGMIQAIFRDNMSSHFPEFGFG